MNVSTGETLSVTNALNLSGGTLNVVGGTVSAGSVVMSISSVLDLVYYVSVAVNDVLVKYTWYGDANLDGNIDGTDYSRIDNGYLTHLTGWFNGDFNYDNTINGSDYTLIDNTFNMQGTQLTAQIANPTAQPAATSDTSAVPEPACLVMQGIAAAALLGRRRPQHH